MTSADGGGGDGRVSVTAADAFLWDDPVDLDEYMARTRPKAHGKTSGLVVRLARAIAGSVEGNEGAFEAFLPEAYEAVEVLADWLGEVADQQLVGNSARSVERLLRDEIAKGGREDAVEEDGPDYVVREAYSRWPGEGDLAEFIVNALDAAGMLRKDQ